MRPLWWKIRENVHAGNVYVFQPWRLGTNCWQTRPAAFVLLAACQACTLRPARLVRPEGLTYLPDFLSEEEERALVSVCEPLPLEPVRMRGGVGRRETIHFGYDYDYDAWTLQPAPDPPEAFAEILRRCAETASISPEALQQVMVARYPPGATINWHRDAPMFGSPVIGISLLSRCEMRFRRAVGRDEGARRRSFERYALVLEPRSLYILDGEARTLWQHSIPPTESLRLSITMRTLKAGGS